MLTFDTTREHVVNMKIGISFVSVANARANLAAENRGWNVDSVANAATRTKHASAPTSHERRSSTMPWKSSSVRSSVVPTRTARELFSPRPLPRR